MTRQQKKSHARIKANESKTTLRIISEDKAVWIKGIYDAYCNKNNIQNREYFTEGIEEDYGIVISTDDVSRFFNRRPTNAEAFRTIAKNLGVDYNILLEKDVPKKLLRPSREYFSGAKRKEQIYEIQAKLRQRRNTLINIFGRGGLGKTEIVLKLVEEDSDSRNQQFKGGYCFVYVEAGNIGLKIESFFSEIQKQYKWKDSPPKEMDDAQRVQWYYRNAPLGNYQVLLIFDGVEKYEQIERFLPISNHKNFRVLLTSRRSDLATGCYNILLKDFEEQDAIELVENILQDDTFFYKHQESLTRICRLVGYLPLAVELVTGVISATKLGKHRKLEEFISELENDVGLARVLSKIEPGRVGYIDELPEGDLRNELQDSGLQAVYNLTWRLLSLEAKEIAYIISLFAPSPVHFSLVSSCFEADILETVDEELIRASFLDVVDEDEYVLYHNLTRNFVRGAKESFIEEEYCELRVVYSLRGAIYYANHLHSPFNASLINHIEYWMKERDINPKLAEAVDSSAVGVFNNFVVSIYQHSGDIEKQREFITSSSWKTGDTYLDKATNCQHFATFFMQKNQLEFAEGAVQAAIDKFQEGIEKNGKLSVYAHGLIEVYFSAAMLSIRRNKLNKARRFIDRFDKEITQDYVSLWRFSCHLDTKEQEYFQAFISIVILLVLQSMLQNRHKRCGDVFFLKALVLKAKNKLEEATKYFHASLEELSNLYNISDNKNLANSETYEAIALDKTINIYVQLASIYFQLKNIEEAEIFITKWEQVINRLPIYEMSEFIATTYYDFAINYAGYGFIDKARSFLIKALQIFEDRKDDFSQKWVAHIQLTLNRI